MSGGGMFDRMASGRRGAEQPISPPGGKPALVPRGQAQTVLGEAEVLAAIETVPALPIVVTQILAQTSEAGTSVRDLERLIGQDMVIAGRLLELVNSPFYGLPNKVGSLGQAAAIIGLRSLRSLVIAASASRIMAANMTGYGFVSRGLWRNAVVVAGLSREVAACCGLAREQADEYFVAGLLRDVGLLVLGPFLDRAGLRLPPPSGAQDIIVHEREALGFDHCWAGERITERWDLPEDIRFVTARHHRVPRDVGAERLHLVAAVRLAERIAARALIGLDEGHPFEQEVDATLLHVAGLDAEAFRNLLGKLSELSANADASGL